MNQVKTFRRKTRLKQVDMVHDAPNKGRLLDYMNPDGRFFAYSLENLRLLYEDDDMSDARIKPTTEFRQHEGTLNVVAIIGWVKFINYLVAYVCSHTDERIYYLAVQYGLDPDFDVYDLMTTIGASYLHGFFPTLHDVLGPSQRLPLETADILPRWYVYGQSQVRATQHLVRSHWQRMWDRVPSPTRWKILHRAGDPYSPGWALPEPNTIEPTIVARHRYEEFEPDMDAPSEPPSIWTSPGAGTNSYLYESTRPSPTTAGTDYPEDPTFAWGIDIGLSQIGEDYHNEDGVDEIKEEFDKYGY